MGGVQGIHLDTGFGASFAGSGGYDETSFAFSVTPGITIGLGYDAKYLAPDAIEANIEDTGYDIIQLPINFNATHLGNSVWTLGGETGLRFDWILVNLDVLVRMGALTGNENADAAFGVAPTLRAGFLKDAFGLDVSVLAYSGHEEIGAPRTTVTGYFNPLFFLGVAAGAYTMIDEQVEKLERRKHGYGDYDIDRPEHSDYTDEPSEVEEPSTDIEQPQNSEPASNTTPSRPAVSNSDGYARCDTELKDDAKKTACKSIVDVCMAANDASASVILRTDVGSITAENRASCLDMAINLAALDYVLKK
ncbi:MAG: hypothetical protein ABH871_04155 [Pseudomonadota bacterium]